MTLASLWDHVTTGLQDEEWVRRTSVSFKLRLWTVRSLRDDRQCTSRVGLVQSSTKGASKRPLRSGVFEQNFKGKVVESKYRESAFREQKTQARSPRVWKYMATGVSLLTPQ